MATTTNYSWTTPDDTDLVKDGAAAIRTLGSSIDTTTKNLNPQTTTGALAYRSATSNVNTALAIGTAGQVLTVNSGATAPEWATPAAGGGMTSIATGTLSGSDVTLSTISASYKDLKLVIRDFLPSDDGRLIFAQFNADTSSKYYSTSIGSTTNQTLAAQMQLHTGQDNGSSNCLIVWDLKDYANTTTWKISFVQAVMQNETTPANLDQSNRVAYWADTAAISSIKLFCNAGTFSGGTYILYGVN